MTTDYMTHLLLCVTEPDGNNAEEELQPIQRQEASHDAQGANVQVCFNESTNNITFRTFRSA
jgi:hypothetical protein